MIEDGMIRLYNKSAERVSHVINGVRITIPAHGSANVSERKGRRMLELYPMQLTEDSEYDKHKFSAEDVAKVDKMDLDACRECLRVFMAGQSPDLDKAVEETELRSRAEALAEEEDEIYNRSSDAPKKSGK